MCVVLVVVAAEDDAQEVGSKNSSAGRCIVGLVEGREEGTVRTEKAGQEERGGRDRSDSEAPRCSHGMTRLGLYG